MKTLILISAFTISTLGAIMLLGSRSHSTSQASPALAQVSPPFAGKEKNAYYGDLHLHTTQSFDAYVFGTRIGPEEAYRYAKGETIEFMGEKIRRNFPLDFLAVTDHSENIGVLTQLNDTNSLLSRSEIGKKFKKAGTDRTPTNSYFFMADYSGEAPGFDNKTVTRSAWQRQIDAANNSYEPGKFTSFIAYEWTSAPDRQNLHRNVIFKDAKATDRPFSAIDSKDPRDLWKYLNNLRSNGVEALAIPHNPNASNGLMFDWNDLSGKPIDKAYAESKAFNEPITEISQSKGQSETHPELSPTDEFSNFELVDFMSPRVDSVRKKPGSYVRDAYGRGLIIKEKTGVNPYKFGIVGAGDLHGGLDISDERSYEGTASYTNKSPEKTFTKGVPESRGLYFSPGNITGVWAEANTRESIYDAFRRKETFATTGTKLKFRFFGGWDLSQDILKTQNWDKAYEKGVSMGGDLPLKPQAAKAPSFLVWAIKDPNGANLDRIQVIKVWVKEGKSYEKVFDVALADGRKPDPSTGKVKTIGNTVDLKTATYTNTIGDTELSTLWTDPQYDAKIPAVYYLRVIEIPTPRWSTILAVKHKLPIPAQVASTIQERGWSSPIWYTPQK
jgi:hypothetical protein